QSAGIVGNDFGNLQRRPRCAQSEGVHFGRLAGRGESWVAGRGDDLVRKVRAFEVKLEFRAGRKILGEQTGKGAVAYQPIIAHAVVEEDDPFCRVVRYVQPPPEHTDVDDGQIIPRGGAKSKRDHGLEGIEIDPVEADHRVHRAVVHVGRARAGNVIDHEGAGAIRITGVGEVVAQGGVKDAIHFGALTVDERKQAALGGQLKAGVIRRAQLRVANQQAVIIRADGGIGREGEHISDYHETVRNRQLVGTANIIGCGEARDVGVYQ